MKSPEQFFSVEDANRMLPLVRQIMGNIICIWEKILKLRDKLTEATEKVSQIKICRKEGVTEDKLKDAQKEEERAKDELNDSIDTINRYIKEIESLGLLVAEFKNGVVHFPTIRADRAQFLCYAHNEDEVCHWHEYDEACVNKEPIKDAEEFKGLVDAEILK